MVESKIIALRKQMNNIDDDLIKILSKRAKLTKKIKKIKENNKIKVRDVKREQEIIERLKIKAEKMNLRKDYVESIYKIILKEFLK